MGLVVSAAFGSLVGASWAGAAGTFQFTGPESSGLEGGTAQVWIERTDTTGTALVSCVTSAGSAIANVDYGAATVSAFFDTGQTTAQCTIPLLSDEIAEPFEDFYVTIDPDGAGGLGQQSTIWVRIVDDDGFGDVQLQLSETEVSEDSGGVYVNVIRSGDLTGGIIVRVAILEGTATSADFSGGGWDFFLHEGTSGNGGFIPIVNDGLAEGPETFFIETAPPAGNWQLVSPPLIEVTIQDGSAPPVPHITGVQLPNANLGTPGIVFGSGFVPGIRLDVTGPTEGEIFFGLAVLPTQFVFTLDPLELPPGTYEVQAFNPGDIGSNIVLVELQLEPAPMVTSLIPTYVAANDFNAIIRIDGTGLFWNSVLVLSDGEDTYELPVGSLSDGTTQWLETNIATIWPSVPEGEYDAWIWNPDGQVSNIVSLTVGPVIVPEIDSVNPAQVEEDAVEGTIHGSGFLGDATVQLDGPGGGYSTGLVDVLSESLIEFSFEGQDIPPGAYTLRVFNPLAVESNGVAYEVAAAPPSAPPSSPPPVSRLVAGGTFSMRLLDSGELLGWGNPASLPGGVYWASYLPVPWPIEESADWEVVSIAGGDNFGFALTAEGEIWGWGANYHGQLNGSGLDDVAQVDTGHDHGIALRGDGTVWTWGNNAFNQLGRSGGSEPGRVPGLSGIDRVSAGFNQTMALDIDSGTVWVWGAFVGQTPTQVAGTTNPVGISAGGNEAGTILQADGVVKRVSAFSGSASAHPVPGLPANIVDVETGSASSAALGSDGRVWAWGQNYGGLVGAGLPPGTYFTAQEVVGLPPIVEISVSSAVLVVDENGEMWGWGDNYLGQIGDGTTALRFSPSKSLAPGSSAASCFAEGNRLRWSEFGWMTECQFIPSAQAEDVHWSATGLLGIEPAGGLVTLSLPPVEEDPLPGWQVAGVVTATWVEDGEPRSREITLEVEGPTFCPDAPKIAGQLYQCWFNGFDQFVGWEATGFTVEGSQTTQPSFWAESPGPASITAVFLDGHGQLRRQTHDLVISGPTGISPESVVAQPGPLLVTVSGHGFSTGWVVRANGITTPTQVVSNTELVATIPAGMVASPGALDIAVAMAIWSPSISAGVIEIQPATPTISNLAPAALSTLAASNARVTFEIDRWLAGDWQLLVSGNNAMATDRTIWIGEDGRVFGSFVPYHSGSADSIVVHPGTVEIRVATPGGVSNTLLLFVTESETAVTDVQVVTNTDPTEPVTAVAGDSQTVEVLAATTGGTGTVAVAVYESNPGSTPSFDAGGFVDVYVSPESEFEELQVRICGTGEVAYWFDGTGWVPASHQVFDAQAGCVYVTILAEGTVPTLNQLTGTFFTLAPGYVPEITSISATPALVPVGGQTALEVSIADLDLPTDSHSWTVDWGDGSTSEGNAGNEGSFDVNHNYATAGVYSVVVTVQDADGSTAQSTFDYVVVYDNTAGFVTGGGWFESPVGAYAEDPTLTGKATFGFVSQYKKGAHVPSGNTEFRFQAAGLTFKSTAYEWLVVAGSKAQFRGTGTINGSGDYAFFITATDGGSKGTDKFRIRIWDRAGGGLVYDNQAGSPENAEPSTVLGGGSIVIHR